MENFRKPHLYARRFSRVKKAQKRCDYKRVDVAQELNNDAYEQKPLLSNCTRTSKIQTSHDSVGLRTRLHHSVPQPLSSDVIGCAQMCGGNIALARGQEASIAGRPRAPRPRPSKTKHSKVRELPHESPIGLYLTWLRDFSCSLCPS
jgi:hypothetical protein